MVSVHHKIQALTCVYFYSVSHAWRQKNTPFTSSCRLTERRAVVARKCVRAMSRFRGVHIIEWYNGLLMGAVVMWASSDIRAGWDQVRLISVVRSSVV